MKTSFNFQWDTGKKNLLQYMSEVVGFLVQIVVMSGIKDVVKFAKPKGAKIGTSSPRRTAFLKNFRQDFSIELCRGNIETRISKFKNKEYDAIVLAEAGLSRLNLNYTNKIPLHIMPPAAGQGAIAIQCIENPKFSEINKVISSINNEKAFFETKAEFFSSLLSLIKLGLIILPPLTKAA